MFRDENHIIGIMQAMNQGIEKLNKRKDKNV
jgi:hypothetical protein